LQGLEPSSHCGSCTACLTACPTQAFVGPYQLDARRCISYLTIEHAGDIAPELRPLIGNRLYGCDDCQRVCPWNKYAQLASHPDFRIRHDLDQTQLLELLAWRQADFDRVFRGSAVLRIGYGRWLRNLAVVAGNAIRACRDQPDRQMPIVEALRQLQADLSPGECNGPGEQSGLTADQAAQVVRHIDWALAQAATCNTGWPTS
jgi:epoxyqueuosine reductase